MRRLGAVAALLGLLSAACAGVGADLVGCAARRERAGEVEACAAEEEAASLLQKQALEVRKQDRRRDPGEVAASRLGAGAFSVQSLTLGGPNGDTAGLKVLKNTQSGESVDIAWTFGGKVDALRLRSPVTGKVRDLLVSSGRNATKLLSMGWSANEFLIPFANRIENGTYTDTVNGRSRYMERTDHEATGDNAIHGFLKGKQMDVVSESSDMQRASVTLAYSFNDAGDPETMPKGYPYPLAVQITYTLDLEGFSVTVSAKNMAEQGGPLPFYMGMHPYFVVTDVSKSSVLLDPCSEWNQIEVDENSIPTRLTVPFDGFSGAPVGGSSQEPTRWDTGFKALASASACSTLRTEVYDPGFGDSSVLWMRSPEFKWLQIFTGGTPTLGQVIAVEPMSGETDAFNNEQAVELLLQAGETWEGTFGFKVKEPSVALVLSGPST